VLEGKLTWRDLAEKIPSRNRKQIISHYNKTEYKIKKNYGYLKANPKKMYELSSLIADCDKNNNIQGKLVHFIDKTSGKDVALPFELLSTLIINSEKKQDSDTLYINLDLNNLQNSYLNTVITKIQRRIIRDAKK
jgi:hypothetical protein